MSNAIYKVPETKNEPVLSYAPGSAERAAVKATLKKMRAKKIDIPMVIAGKDVYTKTKVKLHPPCLLYTSPSPRDRQKSRMPSSA